MESLGETLRKLHGKNSLPLRTVVAYLDIDQAILSKIERGQRKANREQVVKLAEFYQENEKELLFSWLSDKLVHEVGEEEVALNALQVAEKKIEYIVFNKVNKKEIVKRVKLALKQFDKIQKAWVLGSFSRNEDGPNSDLDLAIETDVGFSYFDLAHVQHVLEKEMNRKVDVGFLDSLKPHILNHIHPDLKLIYNRECK